MLICTLRIVDSNVFHSLFLDMPYHQQMHQSVLTPTEPHASYSYCNYGNRLEDDASQTHVSLPISNYPGVDDVVGPTTRYVIIL